MAISVAISCLHFDKRKGLMSSLERRNDVVRCNRQQRYKFIVNGTWTMFHGVINVDAAIMGIGTMIKFLRPSTPVPTSPCIISCALCGWRAHQLGNPQGAKG
jgi:hypothetical protein